MGGLYGIQIMSQSCYQKKLCNFHTGVLNMLTYAYTEKEKTTLLTLGI